MSLGWKVAIWIVLVITVFGILGNAYKESFMYVLIYGGAIIAICIKCLEQAKQLEK